MMSDQRRTIVVQMVSGDRHVVFMNPRIFERWLADNSHTVVTNEYGEFVVLDKVESYRIEDDQA